MTASQVKDHPGVSVNLGAASVLHRPSIQYPGLAEKAGIQGTVSLEATFDSAGNVVDARVLSGPTELRRNTLESILQWHFNANASQVMRVVHVSFDLAADRDALREEKLFTP